MLDPDHADAYFNMALMHQEQALDESCTGPDPSHSSTSLLTLWTLQTSKESEANSPKLSGVIELLLI
jgi:hypothetical protein